MPTILEYARVFSLLKKIVRTWCRVVGGWLKLDSYLLPANAQQRRRAAAQRPVVEPRADESDSDSDEDDGEAQPAEQNMPRRNKPWQRGTLPRRMITTWPHGIKHY